MKLSKKALAFIAIDIACFLTVLDSTIVNVSLPNMASYFKTNATGISWVSTAYLIAFSSLLINFSKIADIYGRKKLFLSGLILFGLSSILCGLADSLPLLIACRVMQGVGAAILTPLSIPLGIELYGKQAMAKLSVIVGMTISISAASGPVLGGILNQFYSYRAIFYVNIPFVVIALLFGALYINESYDDTIIRKIDFIGCGLLATSLGTLTFLLVKGNDYGWISGRIMALIGISTVSAAVFILYEGRIDNPMIEFGLFKFRTFSASIILIAVYFFAYMPVSYLLNFYFENTLGYTVLKAGLMMGIPSVTALVAAPLMPIFYKKLSTQAISLLSILIAVSGNLLFVFMNRENHMLLICISLVLLGLGVRITTVLYQTTYEEVPMEKNGIASGIQNSLRQLSACIAIALVATLSSKFTALALQNTKAQVIQEVNGSRVLTQEVKSSFVTAVKRMQGGGGANKGITRESIRKMFVSAEKKVPIEMSVKVKLAIHQKMLVQQKEADRILGNAESIKETESYRVYNKCFLTTGLTALLGLLAVPFNKRKEEQQIDGQTVLE